MECCCYLRTVHDRMADGKTAYEKRFAVTCDGPSTPFGAKSATGPSLRETRPSCVNFAGRCFPISPWEMYRVRDGDGQAICSSRIAKTSRSCQPQTSMSNGSSSRISHKKESCWFHVQWGLSNSAIFLNHHAAKSQPRETLSQLKKKKTPCSKKKNGKICLRHERLLHISPSRSTANKAIHPDEATFSVKPTKTSIDNASEHTLTDYRNAESQVLLSDEIGTTR